MGDGDPEVRLDTLRATGKRRLLIADLWCGGGGTSTGATRALAALDRPFDLVAVNHWPVAIATHSQNHPEGRHYCTKMEDVSPLSVVPGGRLDLLMASPTCTFHSRARGGKPVNDQMRADPWLIVRWCTELRVKAILIENVPEIMDWGPCSLVTNRPMKSAKGKYFLAWVQAFQALGFKIEYGVLCCADYGDPTSRKRFFMIGRSDGKPVRWPEQTHAKGGSVDLFRALPKWRSAAEIIDWTIPGKSIFNRKKPLKSNTVRRILAGAVREQWPAPFAAALQALLDGNEPVLDVIASDAEPLLVRLRGTHSNQLTGSASRCDVPLPTLTAGGGHVSVVMAIGSGGAARNVSEPVPTITGGGNGASPQLITPMLMGVASTARAKGISEPLPTITTGGGSSEKRPGNARPQLIEGSILLRAGHGDSDGRDPAGRLVAIDAPLPALTGTTEVSLAEAFIVPVTHAGDRAVHAISDPLKTITGANRGELGLVQFLSNEVRIDITYRMLHWRELAAGMSFDVPGYSYEFAGNATQKVKQIGNAVPCNTAQALVDALMNV